MRLGIPAAGGRPAAIVLSIALAIGAPDSLAQSSDRERDQERKPPRTGSRDTSTAERERDDRIRRERVREERDRHDRERQQRERHDRERQAREKADRQAHQPKATQPRSRPAPQQADRAREEEHRRHPPSTSRDSEDRRETRTPSAPPAAAARPGPYSLPGDSRPAAPRTAGSTVHCSAHPQCNSATGYGNACRGVQGTYAGSFALDDGMHDIVSRCRAANSPEPCGADARGSQSSADFRLAFGGGCAQQCASAARCTSSAVR